MVDLRRIVMIFIIAVLYSVFVYSFIEAVYPAPEYNDYCGYGERPYAKPLMPTKETETVTCPKIQEATEEEQKSCQHNLGYIVYDYDNKGCPTSYQCSCKPGYRDITEKHELVVFIVSAAFALLAIVIGLHLSPKKNPLNEWVATGFLLGGLVTLFVGTARYFGSMNKIIRPIVILIELIIVIYLTYKKMGKEK